MRSYTVIYLRTRSFYCLKELGAPPLLAIARQPRGIAAQFPLDRFAVLWKLRSQDIAELSNLRAKIVGGWIARRYPGSEAPKKPRSGPMGIAQQFHGGDERQRVGAEPLVHIQKNYVFILIIKE